VIVMMEIDLPESPLHDNFHCVIGSLERREGQYIARCAGQSYQSIDKHTAIDWARDTWNNQPDHAVCNACSWEGSEHDAPGHICPRCSQPDVNYFIQPSDHLTS
jgi:Zn finger protein HypA/HybF involved in hydrogenase expression